jgi:tetratricopeptide (TPR) repeat protein
MHLNNKFLIIVVLFSALFFTQLPAAVFARESKEDMISQRFYMAYESMNTADWFYKKEMNSEAANLYNKALNSFKQIAHDYPSWHPKLLNFRIEYCRKKLQQLDPEDLKQSSAAIQNKPAQRSMSPKPKQQQSVTNVNVPEQDPYNETMAYALSIEKEGRFDDAYDIYAAIINQSPKYMKALKGALRCALRNNAYNQAVKVLQRASLTTSVDADTAVLIAMVKCYQQEYDFAIELLNMAIRRDAENANAHIQLGIAYMCKDRVDKAEIEMKKAIAIDSKMHQAYYNLAWISLKQNAGDIELARAHYQNALSYGAQPDPVLRNLLQ